MNRRHAKWGGASALLVGVAFALGLLLVGAQLGVAQQAQPDFTVTPAAPLPGQTVTFTATGLRGNSTVSWDFDNDGTVDATGTTVQHVYATGGQRTVVMRVTRDGNVTEVRKTVNVDTPPTASFTASPNPATVGQAVQFNATGSSDPGGTIASYAWDLDNDGQFDDATGATASRSFAAPGTYTVGLRVTDNRGLPGTTTGLVTVNSAPAPLPPPNQAPVASFTASPNPATVGQIVQFDAAGSSDPDGTIASYAWDLDNDGQFDDATGTTASRAFAAAGGYTIRLRVTDNRGSTDAAASLVTVNSPTAPPAPPPNQPPVASFTASPNPATVGQTVQFNAASSSDPDGTIASYAWDLDNDGQFDDATGATATRSFALAGVYTVVVRVADNRGATDTASSTVTVNNVLVPPLTPPANRPPIASFTLSPSVPLAGSVVQLTSTSTDSDGSVVSHAWDLDDDGQFDDSFSRAPAVRYAFPGSHPVSLRVTDDKGAVDVASRMIVVGALPGRALELMRPFPIVRIVGRLTRSGARIRLLAVRSAPRGATVTVRCRSRKCGRLRTASKVLTSGSARFRSYQRRVRAGARIQVYVTQAGKIGKYTSFKVRRARPPLRKDLCVSVVGAKPAPCPDS